MFKHLFAFLIGLNLPKHTYAEFVIKDNITFCGLSVHSSTEKGVKLSDNKNHIFIVPDKELRNNIDSTIKYFTGILKFKKSHRLLVNKYGIVAHVCN